MIVLITGASHTGKTALSQKLMQALSIPYFSLDHLKMGLIRSGHTTLTPMSEDADLTAYLWPIAREMIRTALENNQHMIVEGCYIPADWAKDFTESELIHIRCLCLMLSENYIARHFDQVQRFSCVIERRLEDDYTASGALADNAAYLPFLTAPHTVCLTMEEEYDVSMERVKGALGI